ncbi:hypothetical protein NL676_008558 [Syzygium grande]|nr:hypothetical protein NL676_008558 [Syzygium grande]
MDEFEPVDMDVDDLRAGADRGGSCWEAEPEDMDLEEEAAERRLLDLCHQRWQRRAGGEDAVAARRGRDFTEREARGFGSLNLGTKRVTSGCCLGFEAERIGGMWILQEGEEATIILAMATISRTAAAARLSLSSDGTAPDSHAARSYTTPDGDDRVSALLISGFGLKAHIGGTQGDLGQVLGPTGGDSDTNKRFDTRLGRPLSAAFNLSGRELHPSAKTPAMSKGEESRRNGTANDAKTLAKADSRPKNEINTAWGLGLGHKQRMR